MRLALLAAALFTSFGAVVCGGQGATNGPAARGPGDGSPTGPATAAPATAAATIPATAATGPACTTFPGDLRVGQTVARTLTSSGGTREYRIHLPARAKPGGPAPLVLNWHGLGSNASAQEPYSGLVPVSDREGFVLVTPEGTGSPRGFAAFGRSLTADDVQLTRDLIETLARELCIDTARVYSTGMSNGAYMSSRLGCELGDRIAAIAPVAGVYMPPGLTCKRAMPVLAFHGTDDAVVPFGGGLVLGVLPYVGAPDSTIAWAANNPSVRSMECDLIQTHNSALSEHVERRDLDGCAGVPVSLIVVRGGGHTWPGAIDVPTLGPTTHEISAAELIWTFFKDQRLPGP